MRRKYPVVLISFPFSERSGSKVRPAVILTDPVGPDDLVVVAFITSNLAPSETEYAIALGEDAASRPVTGLKQPSRLLLHKMTAIPEEKILRALGELDAPTAKLVGKQLKQLFLG